MSPKKKNPVGRPVGSYSPGGYKYNASHYMSKAAHAWIRRNKHLIELAAAHTSKSNYQVIFEVEGNLPWQI